MIILEIAYSLSTEIECVQERITRLGYVCLNTRTKSFLHFIKGCELWRCHFKGQTSGLDRQNNSFILEINIMYVRIGEAYMYLYCYDMEHIKIVW